jgi:hypothetical protein
MYLVPYIYRSMRTGNVIIHVAKVFLAEGGDSFWKTEEQWPSMEIVRKEYCEGNGIFCKKITIKDEFAYCEVDEDATRLEDFYKWTETKEECWRVFSFFTDTTQRMICPGVLESIYLGRMVTARFLCSEVLRLVT